MSEVIDNPHQSIAAEASFRRVLRHAQRELENDIVSSKGTNDVSARATLHVDASQYLNILVYSVLKSAYVIVFVV